MPDYRIYFLDKDPKINAPAIIWQDKNDNAAIAFAHTCESIVPLRYGKQHGASQKIARSVNGLGE
jgi:hypothetical protein